MATERPALKFNWVKNTDTAIFNCLFRQFPKMKEKYQDYIEGAILQFDHAETNTKGIVGLKITLQQPPYKDLLIFDNKLIIWDTAEQFVHQCGITPNKYHVSDYEMIKSAMSYFFLVTIELNVHSPKIWFNQIRATERFGRVVYRKNDVKRLGQFLRTHQIYRCPVNRD